MISTVSYANVAKSKISDTPSNVSSTSIDSTGSEKELIEKKESKKTKAALAPAPLPVKSAWGATRPESSKAAVDEQKWPTPDKAVLEQQVGSTQKQQKFIKPITNKWVPINAKVILPSGRANSQKQGRSKKNKKSTSGQKKHGNQNGHNVKQSEPMNLPNVSDADKKDVLNESSEIATPEKSRSNGNLLGQAQLKSFKKFNNVNGPNGFKPKFNGQSQRQHFQLFPQHTNIPQNGFFQPQHFAAPPPAYQNFNRNFRPSNYHFQNRTYRLPVQTHNGFMNGGISLGPQIPPPISPKQDPQEALTQQIDYYFSLENLIKDIFLRKNMDNEGWVPLDLILNFKRVKLIINGIQNSIENKEISPKSIILDSLNTCDNLEVRLLGDKELAAADVENVFLRVKENYEQWILPNEA